MQGAQPIPRRHNPGARAFAPYMNLIFIISGSCGGHDGWPMKDNAMVWHKLPTGELKILLYDYLKGKIIYILIDLFCTSVYVFVFCLMTNS